MTNLTPQQQAFIEACADPLSGSLVLDAKAGTGKTTTLCAAAQHLPQGNRVLAVAFNKKNADELQQRMGQGVECRTLNALGHRAWSSHLGRRLVVDSNKTGKLVTAAIKELGLQREAEDDPDLWKDALKLVSWAKRNALAPDDAMGNPVSLIQDSREIWEDACDELDLAFNNILYQITRAVLRASIKMGWAGEIDFDDQLYMPTIYRSPIPQYDVVMVDEAQDLNSIQHHLVSRAVARGGRCIIVGDPNQSIYGFRGALNESMSRLAQSFHARWFPLSVSFRCPQRVVAAAQLVVPEIEAHPDAPEGLVEHRDSWSPSDFAAGDVVICRYNAPLIRTAYECIRASQSCFMLGRDIGQGLVSTIRQALRVKAKDPIDHISITHTQIKLEEWFAAQRAAAQAKEDKSKLERLSDRRECLDIILELSGATSAAGLVASIQALFAPSVGKITLSSIHRAKGLEWSRVWLLDAHKIGQRTEEGSVAWQQERNCLYVAITRAKSDLIYITSDSRST